jgi:iron complex transport system permease protein
VKIVLDLTELVAEGKLTAAQAEELKALAKPQTSLLAINLLMAFGVFAIAAGVLALLPTAPTAIVLGLVLLGIGVVISFGVGPQWSLLGTAVTIAGALIAGAGIVGQFDGDWIGFALAAILLLALAVVIRSALLSALSVFAIAGLLGSKTGYGSATYFLAVSEPTVTIIAFSLFSLAAYLIGRQAPARYERVAFAFSRISLVMVNFGFWIGSLWGDDPGHSWRGADAGVGIHIPDYVFGIGWAAALVAVGCWAAARVNRRFVVNTAATFGAIHFYTQWFERLGTEPLTILLAGVLVVAIAVGLWRYNARPYAANLAA